MSASIRLAVAAGAIATLTLAPAALHAQAAAAARPATTDSLAFPRQFVKWALTGQGDSAYAHAAPKLQTAMKSPQDVNAMALQIASRFGDAQGNDAEIQFDEADHKVYIVVTRYSQAPEPGAFLVAYSPTTHVVDGAVFTSLTNMKNRFPQAKLP
jgi:hypothetical protein